MSKFLIKNILNLILFRSFDIAPERKKDPGEKFTLHYLNKRKVGLWYSINPKKIKYKRNKKLSEIDKNNFFKNLSKIGYEKKSTNKNNKYIKKIVIAFQRRFRQQLINGIPDEECLLISRNLIKKLN